MQLSFSINKLFSLLRKKFIRSSEPINFPIGLDYIKKKQIKNLYKLATKQMSPLLINNIVIAKQTAMGYFWVGLILENVMNDLDNHREIQEIARVCEQALRKLIKLSPLFVEGQRALARNLWFQGRYEESIQQFQQAEEQRLLFIKEMNMDPNALVLLPVNCGHVIGLMGHIDSFIKRKILSGEQAPYHLVVPEHERVNKVFFDYWAPYLKFEFPVLDDIEYAAINMAYTVNWNWILPETDKTVLHTHSAMAQIQRKWDIEDRRPLLTLTKEHSDLLAKYKADIGMKENDWFVCLHVRADGFYKDKKNTAQDFRNTPIEDYYLVIQTIVELGGWVFRMGDPSMPKLLHDSLGINTQKIIDYAHSSHRSPELDVSLSATCRLFISSNSGLHTVAHAFGKPVCYANYPVYAGFPWHPNEIFIPMLYYSIEKNRILSFEEILSSNLVHADHGFLLAQNGITLIKNTSEEIMHTVLEALQKDQYQMFNLEQAKQLRKEFERLNIRYKRNISGQVGLFFVQKHNEELFPRHHFKSVLI